MMFVCGPNALLVVDDRWILGHYIMVAHVCLLAKQHIGLQATY